MSLGFFQAEELTAPATAVRVLTEPPEHAPMAHPNFESRTLYTADNLDIMRGMNSESVDLIYLDPPFNSKKNYAAPIGSKAAGAEFQDTWSLDDVKKEWVEDIEADNTATWSAITSAGHIHGESSQAYLTYMAVRLLEMRRILKSTGSIYLHCDPTMSHYLKLVMDAVFGRSNFVNEVIWYYRGAGVPKQAFARRHDVILLYARRRGQHHFDVDSIRRPYADTTVKRFSHYIGNVRGSSNYGQQKLNPLGKHPDDVIVDIQPIAPSANARLGYPTQKPLDLLERVIEASSNEGDMVLDPFCGCATTCIAAERLKRQWVGIDVEEKARDLVVQRLEREVYKDILHKGGEGFLETYHLRKPPKRTDPEAPVRSRNIKQVLYKRQDGRCKGPCERTLDMDLFEIDHVVPRSRGGSDTDGNLQLLCPPCNRRKGSKTMARFLELMEGE